MSAKTPLAVIILAAGKGTRMKSELSKAMHKIAGLPMIHWLLQTAESLEPKKIIIVRSTDMDDLADAVKPHDSVIQKKQLGTGDAVKSALAALKGFKGDVLILLADMPLITTDTLKNLIGARHTDKKTALAVLGAEYEIPPAFGRLFLNSDKSLARIIEDKDCTPEERAIRLCNTGAFCVDSEKLSGWLEKINSDNVQGEYYITDLPEIAAAEGFKTAVSITQNEEEVTGVNSRADLSVLEAIVQDALRYQAMDDGATLIDPYSVHFSFDTRLGRDVVIEPNVFFGPGVDVSDGVTVHAFSHLEGVKVERGAQIGPFTRIRPKSHIGENAMVGNFVEVNRTEMQAGSKAKHVSYLGDADIGERTNIGAGTVIANYDGFEKNETRIGKGVFIGSNATLVAPLDIGEGAYVAAGSTITDNVPANALSVARNRPIIRDNWAKLYRERKQKKRETA